MSTSCTSFTETTDHSFTIIMPYDTRSKTDDLPKLPVKSTNSTNLTGNESEANMGDEDSEVESVDNNVINRLDDIRNLIQQLDGQMKVLKGNQETLLDEVKQVEESNSKLFLEVNGINQSYSSMKSTNDNLMKKLSTMNRSTVTAPDIKPTAKFPAATSDNLTGPLIDDEVKESVYEVTSDDIEKATELIAAANKCNIRMTPYQLGTLRGVKGRAQLVKSYKEVHAKLSAGPVKSKRKKQVSRSSSKRKRPVQVIELGVPRQRLNPVLSVPDESNVESQISEEAQKLSPLPAVNSPNAETI